MEDKEIVEGNRLIALFEGYREIPNWDVYDFGYTRHPTINVGCYGDIQLEYHRKWGWLMPVVEKIEKIPMEDGRGEVNPIVTIECNYCIISQGGENTIVEVVWADEERTKIQAVWQAAVEFIKWYNTHNQ